MRRSIPLMLVSIFALLCQSGAAPPDSGAQQIQLKLVPLESPQAVLSKADAASAEQRLREGMIMPSVSLQLIGGVKEMGFNLGGSEFSLQMEGTSFRIKSGQTITPLKQNGMSVAPVTLQMRGGHEYILAFPYAYSYSMGGMISARSGGAMQGPIGSQTITVYDDDLDGRYTLANDVARIGSDDTFVNVFAPLSKYLATSQQVYEVQALSEDGASLTIAPYSGKTGKLSIQCTLPDVQLHVVMQSRDANLNCVAVAGSGAPAELAVIPGSYQILYGAVFSLKTNTMVALLSPGSLPTTSVTEGQTATLTLGGPLTLAFDIEKQPNKKIAISSSTFQIKGKAGERYQAVTWGPQSPPEVSAKNGSGTLVLGKMAFG